MSKRRVLSVVLAVLLSIPIISPVFAGGGPNWDDGRELEYIGMVSPRVDFESLSYNDGVFAATKDGKVVIIRKTMDGTRWVTMEKSFCTFTHPIYNNGIVGYDTKGYLSRTVNGTTTILYSKLAFKEQVRPAFSATQMIFGGGNLLVVKSRTGKPSEQIIKLGTLSVGSVTIDKFENIYFTATENGGKSKLYAAYPSKRGYVISSMNLEAQQVCFGAERLYIVEKWGLTSGYFENGKFVRDAQVETPGAGPFVLCGGNDIGMAYFSGYCNLQVIGCPLGLG